MDSALEGQLNWRLKAVENSSSNRSTQKKRSKGGQVTSAVSSGLFISSPFTGRYPL